LGHSANLFGHSFGLLKGFSEILKATQGHAGLHWAARKSGKLLKAPCTARDVMGILGHLWAARAPMAPTAARAAMAPRAPL